MAAVCRVWCRDGTAAAVSWRVCMVRRCLASHVCVRVCVCVAVRGTSRRVCAVTRAATRRRTLMARPLMQRSARTGWCGAVTAPRRFRLTNWTGIERCVRSGSKPARHAVELFRLHTQWSTCSASALCFGSCGMLQQRARRKRLSYVGLLLVVFAWFVTCVVCVNRAVRRRRHRPQVGKRGLDEGVVMLGQTYRLARHRRQRVAPELE